MEGWLEFNHVEGWLELTVLRVDWSLHVIGVKCFAIFCCRLSSGGVRFGFNCCPKVDQWNAGGWVFFLRV